MKDASLGEPVIGDLRYAIPGQTGPLTAPPKRPPPEIGQIEPKRSKRRSRPIRKGLAWGLQSVDQRVCKSLAGGMEAATTENYEVRPNDQGRSSSIRDCG